MPAPADRTLVVEVPATSANLGAGFDVLALALDWTARLEVAPGGRGLRVVPPAGAPAAWADPAQNLVARAFARGWAAAGEPEPPAAELRSLGTLPIGRGLGSSAAAVVAGLTAAGALSQRPLPPAELLRLAAEFEGHPDNVAAALLGGLTVAVRHADGTVAPYRVPVRGDLHAVVFLPTRALDTKAARAVLPSTIPLHDAVFNAGRCALLVRALLTGDYPSLRTAMEDRWHQPHRTRLLPALPAVIAAALEAGADGAALSGAGPSVLALAGAPAAGRLEAIARAMEAAGAGGGPPGAATVTRPRDRGAVVTWR